MSNIRYLIIVCALFAVLLSAFGVECHRTCAETDEQCLKDSSWYSFPATRLLYDLKGGSGKNDERVVLLVPQ
jgi:hypothetical protein